MKLTPKDIASMLDHSTLQPFLTQDDVRKGCEIALRYSTASVCARRSATPGRPSRAPSPSTSHALPATWSKAMKSQ